MKLKVSTSMTGGAKSASIGTNLTSAYTRSLSARVLSATEFTLLSADFCPKAACSYGVYDKYRVVSRAGRP